MQSAAAQSCVRCVPPPRRAAPPAPAPRRAARCAPRRAVRVAAAAKEPAKPRAKRVRVQPRRLPALRIVEEDALAAAAEAEAVAPPTATEEQLFAEVEARAAEMGVTELLRAYVRILGRRVAFLAVVGNKGMLANVNTIEEIDEIVAEITRLAGSDGCSRILYREPSVLYGTPTAVAESIAALEETLGSAAASFALGRNPALLQSGRAQHIRVALQTLQDILGGDGALAAEVVQKNTMLLGTNSETMRGAFEALCAMFGGAESALGLIRCNPGLLRTKMSTLYESIDTLAEIFGSMDAAADAVNLNRSLLKARPDTLRGAFAALVEVYGSEEAARAVARMQLGVLRSRPATIRAAYAALREECGEQPARSMIEMTPGLLQIRPAALRYNLAHFKAFLGDERAGHMADAMPHLIKMRVGRAAEVTAALVEVYGSPKQAAANSYPPTYRLTGEFLRERWKNLKTAFGDSEETARALVLTDPQLLTCHTWDATLARLQRTGVITLDSFEAAPAPAGEEAPPRPRPRKLSPGKTGSVPPVKKPQRSAKTVQGAAAVAEAVAKAQHAQRPPAKQATKK